MINLEKSGFFYALKIKPKPIDLSIFLAKGKKKPDCPNR